MVGFLFIYFSSLFINLTREQILLLFALSICFDIWLHVNAVHRRRVQGRASDNGWTMQ